MSAEKALQKGFEESQRVLDQIRTKLVEGQPITSELAYLGTLEDEIKASLGR